MKRNLFALMFVGTLAALTLLASAGGAQAASSANTAAGVVNINTASYDQLLLIPGIGPSKAKAILDLRVQRPFTQMDDLRKVKGIGPKLLDRIRVYVVTEGETTAKAPPKKPRKGRK